MKPTIRFYYELTNSVLWTELCLPFISQVHILMSLTASVTALEERAFAEVIKAEWGHKGEALLQ